MNGDTVFVGLAAFQINGVAAYPAEIAALQLRFLQIASSPRCQRSRGTLMGGKTHVSSIKDYLFILACKAPKCATVTSRKGKNTDKRAAHRGSGHPPPESRSTVAGLDKRAR